MIIPRLPQNGSDQKGFGFAKAIRTVWLSSFSTRSISR